MEFGFDWPSGFGVSLKMVDGRADGRWTDDGLWLYYKLTNEPKGPGELKMACVPSEGSDQPRHQPSLIRVFAVCMRKAWVLSYPMSALWMPRLIRVFAGRTFYSVGFVMRRLKFLLMK